MKKHWLVSLFLSAAACIASAPPADTLETGFRHPPDAAKPLTWWHWLDGNVTKKGITQWPDWLVQGQPRPSGRIAFCTRKDVYTAKDELLESGLLGPVKVLQAVSR